MFKGNGRTGKNVKSERGAVLVRAAEWFSLGKLLGVGRRVGWSRAMSSAVVAAACAPAMAGPEGATVVRGQVDITRQGANTLIRAGNNSIINYRSFNIGTNESVRFIQPNASSRVLNRITTAAPTRIDGSLTANGRVYIVNPAGVLFGQGARLNVGGLYAAAGNLSDRDFVAGRNNFTNLRGEVSNQGVINANFAGLIGKTVYNSGTIVAPQGTIVMAAGQEVMVGERGGGVFVKINGPSVAGVNGVAVENTGALEAVGGKAYIGAGDIYSLAVRTTGTIKAKNVTVEGTRRGGVEVSGVIDASDKTPGATGGSVDVLGQRISLINAQITAAGESGGGQVHVGGDFQGHGDRRRAETVTVDKNTVIDASALGKGNGGTVVMWSDQVTRFSGQINSKGGAEGGDGGQVEVSGKEFLAYSGNVNTLAPKGKTGHLLLDPRDIVISAGAGADDGQLAAGTPAADAAGHIGANDGTVNQDFTLGAATINASTSNIDISATRNITISSAVAMTGAGLSFSANAGNNLTVSASLATNNGAISLTAGDTLAVGGAGSLNAGSGAITLTANTMTFAGAISGTGALNISGNTTRPIIITSATPGGSLNLAPADLTNIGATFSSVNIGNSSTSAVTVSNAVVFTSATIMKSSGAISIDADVTAPSLTVWSGSDGSGNLGFGAAGVDLNAASITLRAGDGAGGTATATVDALTNAPAFHATAGGATSPTSFTLQTDAAITDATTPAGAQFAGGLAGLAYTLKSDDSTVTVSDATKVDTSALTLNGTGVTLSAAAISVASVDVTGATTLSGDITTAGATARFHSAVTLGSNVTITTAGGAITFDGTTNGTTAATERLFLDAGAAGTITMTGAVGGNTSLGGLTFTNANNVNTGALTVGNFGVIQTAGAGTTTLGTINASAVNLTGTAITLGAVTTTTGSLTVANTGLFTLGGVAVLNTGLTQSGGGNMSLGANITATTGNISIADSLTVTSSVALTATTGTIALNNALQTTSLGANNVTFTANDINLNGGNNTVSGTGIITLRPVTDGASIGIGGGAGTLQLTTGDVNALANGFSQIVIGRTLGTHAITINAATFKDPVLIQSPVAGGSIAVNGQITGTGNASVTLTGSGSTTTLGANIVTAGAAIQINDAVILGANILLDSTNGGGTATGANIGITGTVEATTDSTEGLTLNAGTAGDISLGGALGATNRLGTFAITEANSVSGTSVRSTTITQTHSGGTTAFTGGLNTSAIGGISFNGVVFNLTGGATTTNGGTFSVTNTGQLTFSGSALTLDGAFDQQGAGNVVISNNISTTSDTISFASAVRLAASVQMTTLTSGTGADITFSSTLNGTAAGSQALQLTAGTTGDILFSDDVGATTRLGLLTLSSANDVTAEDLTLGGMVQTAGAGTTLVNGNINTNAGGVVLTGTAINLAGTVTTGAGGSLTVTNSGQFTLGGAASLDGVFSQSGGGAVQLNAGITTTNDNIQVINNTTIGANGLTFNSGTATILFTGSVTIGANALTLTGDEITFNGGAGTVTGSSTLVLQSATDGVTVNVGNGVNNAGQLDLTASDVAALGNGFSQITIGRATGTQAMNISATTWSDPVLFRSPGGGTISVGGNITGTGDASVTITGTSAVNLGANIRTAGQAIQINGPVLLGATAVLDSTNSGAVATGANIGITGAVNATTVATQGLTLNAGTGGDITLGGAVGGTRLGAFVITEADDVSASSIAATTITQTHSGGTTAFTGALNTSLVGGISLNGAVFNLSGGATTTTGGTFTITNTGLLTISTSPLSLDGAFSQTGAGGTQLNSGITTTGDSITFAGDVTAGVGVTSLDAGSATLTFGGLLTLGSNAFTLTANTMAFNGGNDSVTGSSTLTIQGGAVGTNIGVAFNAGVGALSLTAGSLDALADGFSQITIGRSNGTGNITIGAVSFRDPVLIQSPGGTITVGGDITGTDNASISLTGPTSIAGATTISTDNQAILITGTLNLSSAGLVTLDSSGTGATGANIGVTGAITASAASSSSLSLDAGTTGDITLGGAVGTVGTPLLAFTIDSADDVTTAAISADTITQTAGGGTSDFGLLTAGAGGISLTGTDITLTGGAATSGGGTMTVNNSGLLTISSDLDLDGAFDQTGTGAVTVNAAVNTTGDSISFAGAVTVGGSVTGLDAGTGTITIGSTLDTGSANFTMTADDLVFGGGADSITGTGTLTLQPSAAGVSIGIAGGAGTLSISTTDLAALADGFAQLNIGRADGTHDITIGAVSFRDPVLIRSPLAGGSISVTGQINGTDNGSIALNSLGGITLGSDIITQGSAITLTGPVLLAANITLDTTDAPGTAGADITVTGDVDATNDGTEGLTMIAAGGDVSVTGDIGSGTRLGAFQITSANDVDLAGVAANSFLQVVGTGTTTVTGLIDAAVGGINLTNDNIDLSGGVVTANGVGMVLHHTGQLTISGGSVDLDGTFSEDGGGDVALGTDITTTGDNVTFNGDLTLTGDSSVLTGTAADVEFNGTVDGTFALTVDADTGSVGFFDDVGQGAALGVLTVSRSGTTHFDGALSADQVEIHSTGAVTVTGAVDATNGFSSSGTTFDALSSITTTDSVISILHSGDVNLLAVTAGNAGITVTGDDVIIGGAVAGSGFTLNGQGNVAINADVTASGGAGTSISAGSDGTGNLTFGAGVDISANAMTLSAGSTSGSATIDVITNSPTFHGAAGGATSPVFFQFRQAGNISGANLADVSQFANGIAGMDYRINSRNGTVTIDDASKVDTANLRLTSDNGITISDSLSVAALRNTTAVTYGASVTTTGGNIQNDAAAVTNGSVTLDAGSGLIIFTGTLDAAGTDLTLTARDITLGGAVTPSGGGLLVMQTSNAARDIYLGGTGLEGTGDMHLTSAEVALLGDGFSSITIGRTDSFGTIFVKTAVSFSDALILNTPAISGPDAGAVSIEATLTGTDDASILINGSGATTTLSADIITAGGTVTIDDKVVIAGTNVKIDTTNGGAVAAGGDISILGAVDADSVSNTRNFSLLGGTGGAVSVLDVGQDERLSSFTASGASVSLENVSTTGAQTYTGPTTLVGDLDSSLGGAILITGSVILGADVTISSAGLIGTDNITITGTINSDATTRDLTLDAGAGHVTVGGAIGAVDELGVLAVTGVSNSIQSATTSGAQTYSGTTSINGNITGSDIDFQNGLQINSDAVISGSNSTVFGSIIVSQSGENNNLTINSPVTTFGGSIGGTANAELGTLTTDAGGSLTIRSAVIRTSGAQNFGDAVALDANTVITSGGDVTFGSTLNSVNGNRNLTVNTSGGSDTTFAGIVGSVNALGSITTNADGGVFFGGNVKTTGAQTYNDAATLNQNVTFDGVGITFGSTVDSNGTPRSMTIAGHSGAVNILGDVGGTGQVFVFNATGSAVSLRSVTSTGAQTVTGNLTLNGDMESTGSGTINVTGTLTVTGDSSLRTAGASGDHISVTGTVNGANALEIDAGTGNVTLISGAGVGTALTDFTVTGTNISVHRVATTGSQTYNGSVTTDDDLTSATAGSISINGAFTLGADLTVSTGNGNITFDNTVNGPHNLITTAGGGVTSFNGVVGGVTRLTTLTTNGNARINASTLLTNGAQTYNNALVLGADTVLEATTVSFNSTIDSDTTARSLTVNSSGSGETRFFGNVGATNALSKITTNADGVTKVGAAMVSTNGMTFGDAVKITANSTINGGTGSLFFRGAIDADSSATDPTLTLLSNAVADGDTTPFRFATNIGSTRRLGALTLGADRAPPLGATAVFSDGFQADGTILASSFTSTDAFTITTGAGGFTMGRGQKLTAFGALNILSTGTARLGDLTALTTIKVTANAIQLVLRGSGAVLDNVIETPTDSRLNDSGLDIVASGTIDFSVVPTVVGSGNQPSFSNDLGLADAQLVNFGFRQFTDGVRIALFTDSRSGHSGQLMQLDLKSEGPSVTSIASSIAGAIPRDTESRQVTAMPSVGKSLLEVLNVMGVETKDLSIDELVEFMVGRSIYKDLPLKARPMATAGDYRVTVNRLSMRTVQAVVDAYRKFVYVEALDENGKPIVGADGTPVITNRTDEIRDTIGRVWDTYSTQATDPDGAGFRAYLESKATSGTKDEMDALQMLKDCHEVMILIDSLGLSPFEANIPKRRLMGAIRPSAMTDEQMQVAVNGASISMR